jgi:two-component system, cell cycle sensor histidine kinase and response regulator CckA
MRIDDGPVSPQAEKPFLPFPAVAERAAPRRRKDVTAPLKVLLVEDSETDRKLVERELRSAGYEIESERVEDRDSMRAALLRTRWDVVLSGWAMPRFTGSEALAVLKEAVLDVPFIIVSRSIDEETAIGALRAGAKDYMLKDKLARLGSAVEREIRERRQRDDRRRADQDRKRAADELQVSEGRHRILFDLSPLPKWLYDVETLRFLEVNEAAIRHYGYSRDEFLSMTIKDILPPEDVPAVLDIVARGAAHYGIWRQRKKDGTLVDVEVTGHTFPIGGRPCRLVALDDVTERNRAERALRISERRFTRLWDSGTIGICIADVLGNIHDANDEYLRTLGYCREDLLSGKIRWADMTPAEWKHLDKRAVEQLETTGVAHPWEKELLRKDGTRVPVLLGVAITEYPECIAFQLDYSGRKQQDKALRVSEKRLRRLAESGLMVIAHSGVRGEIHEVNDATTRMLGYSREELVSGRLKWDDLTPPEWREADEAARRELLATGVARPWEKELMRKDGVRVPVLAGAALVEDEGGIGIAIDLTALKRAENELRERVNIASLGADVGLALTREGSVREILQVCAEAIVRNLDAAFARIWTLDVEQNVLELQASAGLYTRIDGPHGRVPVGKLEIGRIAEEKKPHLTNDVANDPRIGEPEWARREGMVAFAGYPLLVGGELVGVIALFARRRLSEATMTALAAIGDAVAVGIRRKTAEHAKAGLEAQLRQAQRIEAIGRLSGGIAHDFNNLLSVILSSASFLLEDLDEADPRRADAKEIKEAGERAAALTRQLLAFSRKQVFEPTVIDLNVVFAGVEKMLRRLIGEDVTLVIEPGAGLGSVKADAGQIEQVLVNLVVNARDAMPGGGAISVRTSNEDLDQAYADAHATVAVGRYVMFSVGDAGIGMSAEVQQHLFEPFFTTKEKGKGTGLGLSTSYGIVKQSGGCIWVYSEPGHGTIFKVYLPRVADALEAPQQRRAPGGARGSETVLLLDDDEKVRSAAERILRYQGYAVLVARDVSEAVAIARHHAGAIHLMLSDVVMPGMSGLEVFEAVRKIRPEAAVLFMSGFSEHAVVEKALAGGANFLQKPFTPETLAGRVRDLLDRSRTNRSS